MSLCPVNMSCLKLDCSLNNAPFKARYIQLLAFERANFCTERSKTN